MTRRRITIEWLILAGMAAAVLAVYLFASQQTFHPGFPLDDAWIHQTYARNLATTGTWAFLPGVPSAGSTSPLWSVLLAVGYIFHWMPLAWTYLLGGLALLGVAWLGNRLGWRLINRVPPVVPWLGIFLIGEWHLVWAAGSGMETGLYALLILSAFWLLARDSIPALPLGLVCGLAIWTRPDGITLIGPVWMVIAFTQANWRSRIQKAALAVLGLLLGLGPYLWFNHALGGAWWPNTLYAKQAEYAGMLQVPLLFRFGQLLSLPLIGAGLLLIPGFLFMLWRSWRQRCWVALAAALWWLGYSGMYAVALPVTYQHGRYLIPAMPIYFVLGAAGTLQLFSTAAQTARNRLLRFAGASVMALVWLAFLGQGALAYGEDVAIIETEMVAASQWIAANTPPGAIIAAHDIGALGYFGQHKIIDLAGLISPQVIPFIRDEARLGEYLDQQGADYLVTFPGWYPQLVSQRKAVYVTGGMFSLEAGGENMVVYLWKRSSAGK